MTDLDKMIEAVEAGTATGATFCVAGILGLPWTGECEHYAYRAFHGSLDAAKALHEALLSGWEWSVDAKCVAYVIHPDGPGQGYEEENSASPARAWLLAILKAWRAQQ